MEPMDLVNRIDLVSGFVPVDMQTGANNGTWVDMSKYRGCIAFVYKAIGTAGDDPVITLKQATDNTGATNKALGFNVIREKLGATAVNAIAQWTDYFWNGSAWAASTPGQTPSGTSIPNTYTDTNSAENQAIFAIVIDSTSLDAANKFTHVQISVPDTGTNAQLGCAFYLMFGARYAEDPQQSAIG